MVVVADDHVQPKLLGKLSLRQRTDPTIHRDHQFYAALLKGFQRFPV